MNDIPPEVTVYALGPVSASACAPAGMEGSEVVAAVNRQHPTGISSEWKISDDRKFSTGEPMPCPCNLFPARRHWLVNC